MRSNFNHFLSRFGKTVSQKILDAPQPPPPCAPLSGLHGFGDFNDAIDIDARLAIRPTPRSSFPRN
jgi:hypothetical protein